MLSDSIAKSEEGREGIRKGFQKPCYRDMHRVKASDKYGIFRVESKVFPRWGRKLRTPGGISSDVT